MQTLVTKSKEMASLMGKVHFWTLKEDKFGIDVNIGCYSYHGKGTNENHANYYEELKGYCEESGVVWSPSKKRPEKLRANLKDVEELLATYRCIYIEWKVRNCLQIMLNNGVIITILMKAGTGDIEKIKIDKYLVGKLYSDHIVEVIFCESAIFISYVEPKLTYIELNKKLLSEEANKKWEKLGNADPKITTVDLIGPTGRRLERRLSCNVQNDQLMIWWMSSSDEVWPWTPISTDRERANIHIYNTHSGTDIGLQCYTRTKSDPIWASHSRLHLNQIYTIEQQISRKGDITIDMCVYEITKNKIQRTSTTVIPLSSSVTCHGISLTEDRILLGCKDASLVMYDVQRKNTHLTKAAFVPAVIGWHPSGAIVMVGSTKGQLQCFDMALCNLNLQLLSEIQNPLKYIDLGSHLKFQPVLQKLSWNPQKYCQTDCSGFLDNTHGLLLSIDRGPLTILTFGAGVHNRGGLSLVELISEYIKYSQIDEAVNLLLNMNWNLESDLCFKCLNLIMNHLLKLPLTESREVQLELSLGSYYSSAYPLSDVVTLEYHMKLARLARRFFHHLLRYERFEKAFLLAADIGARDLFMDIHYVATDRGERILAQVALDRADQLENQLDSSSMGSRTSDGGSNLENSMSSSSSSSSYDSDNGGFHSEKILDKTAEKDKSQTDLKSQTKSSTKEAEGGLTGSGLASSHASFYERPMQSIQGQARSSMQASNRPQEPRMAELDEERSRTAIIHEMQDIGEETSEEDEDGHGIVHVVHFGVV